jgi:hypothetical protein
LRFPSKAEAMDSLTNMYRGVYEFCTWSNTISGTFFLLKI